MAEYSSNQTWSRNIVQLLAGLIAVAAITLAAEDQQILRSLKEESTQRQTNECRSMTEIVCETSDFSTFCELLEDTGLKDELHNPRNRWTVFVPTNTALENFGVESLPSSIDYNDTQVDDLAELLLFHRTSDRVDVHLECGKNITMDNGEDVVLVCGNVTDNGVFLFGRGNTVDEGIPEVIVTDVFACNGVIHVINGVMRPTLPTEPLIEAVEDCKSIEEVVCEMEELTSMCTFLTDQIVLESNDTANELWTVFAPTDQGFEDIQGVLGDLSTEELLDVLKYHIVSGEELFSDDLVCDTDVTMGNAKLSRTTCSNSTGFVFQQGPGNVLTLNPRIIQANKTACNGVVHVVDHVMVPGTEIMGVVSRTGTDSPSQSPSKSKNSKKSTRRSF